MKARSTVGSAACADRSQRGPVHRSRSSQWQRKTPPIPAVSSPAVSSPAEPGCGSCPTLPPVSGTGITSHRFMARPSSRKHSSSPARQPLQSALVSQSAPPEASTHPKVPEVAESWQIQLSLHPAIEMMAGRICDASAHEPGWGGIPAARTARRITASRAHTPIAVFFQGFFSFQAFGLSTRIVPDDLSCMLAATRAACLSRSPAETRGGRSSGIAGGERAGSEPQVASDVTAIRQAWRPFPTTLSHLTLQSDRSQRGLAPPGCCCTRLPRSQGSPGRPAPRRE